MATGHAQAIIVPDMGNGSFQVNGASIQEGGPGNAIMAESKEGEEGVGLVLGFDPGLSPVRWGRRQ
jgi:hypothetical protein